MYDLQIALAQAVLDLRENIKLLDTEPRVDFILPAALGALLLDASAMAPRCWGDGDKIASTRGVQIHADNALTNTRRIGTTTTAGSPYIYRHQYLGPVAEFGVDLTGSDVLTAEIAALTKIFSNRKPRPPFLPLIRFVRANPSAVLETTLCNLAAYYIPSGTKLMLGKPKLINSPAHEGLELT
jgi:hypothetical protein